MAVSAAAAPAGNRRLIFGLNVLLASVLACVAFGLAIWAAGRWGGQIDVTSNRVNSLSDGTVKLLRNLEGEVRLTAAYTTANKEAFKFREKHKKFVTDLLDLYESAGRGKLTTVVVDPQQSPAAMEQLLDRLRKKSAYADETKPHKEALEQFPKLNDELAAFGKNEAAEMDRISKADEKLRRVPEVTLISRTVSNLEHQSQKVAQELEDILKADVPRYGQALQAVRDHVSNTRELLSKSQEWLTGTGAGLSGVSEESRAFLSTAAARYQPIIAKLDEFLKKTEKLQAAKLESIYDSLKGGQCIVVETPSEVQVLPETEVWPYHTQRDAPAADGDMQEFAGEEVISSAILHLTQKEKTAVILTRFGGTSLLMPDFSRITNPAQLNNLPPAPYEALSQRLGKDNFQAVEWDVKAEPKPPATPDAKRLVYVVFPPEPPPQANPMQPSRQPGISPEQKQLIFDAIGSSGMAMFLSGWTQAAMPMPGAPGYEFNDYLKKEWGIETKSSFLTIEFTLNPQRKGVYVPAKQGQSASILDSESGFRFTNHAIAGPISGLPAGLPEVSPLQLAKSGEAPAGVTLQTIAEVPATEDVWAFDNMLRIRQDFEKKQGTTRGDTDIAGPFPIAVSGEKKAGDKTQRVVVISSERFASNTISEASQPVMVGNQFMLAQLYPANLNLFINSLHWLTGNADRIAVGPSRGDVPRLKLSDSGAWWVRAFVVGIWPLVALTCGAAVWMWRR